MQFFQEYIYVSKSLVFFKMVGVLDWNARKILGGRLACNLPLGHRLRTFGTALGHRFFWLPLSLSTGCSILSNFLRLSMLVFTARQIHHATP